MSLTTLGACEGREAIAPRDVRKNSGVTEKVQGPASYFPSIESKYGKPVAYWMQRWDSVADNKHMDQVSWLKTEFGMGHGHANAIVAVYRKEHGL